jgi:RnfABCDGE-type electron transport complex B subunit
MFTGMMIALAAGTMLALALAAGYALGWASKVFHVQTDPRLEEIIKVLPGANCGGCGYVGCTSYGEALLKGEVHVDKCSVGGVSCATSLAKILGVDFKPSWPYRAVVHCAADYDARLKRREYRGEPTCAAANVISGVQGCTYGCLGLGDCRDACQFDALEMVNGLAVVDYAKCVGCRACERACPRHIISMVPFKVEQMAVVACSNRDPARAVRQVCTVGCLGCGVCNKLCDLFQVADNLSRLDYQRYEPTIDLRPVAQNCPRKVLHLVGKPTEKDLAAVAGEKLPEVVTADFKTTADRASFRG